MLPSRGLLSAPIISPRRGRFFLDSKDTAAVISRSNVEAAASRIAGRIRRTPVAEIDPTGYPKAGTVWVKLEFMQHTGSFKPRGMFNRILAAAEAGVLPSEGVITASGGNAGAAVAYAAKELGAAAEVYVPATTPAVKVDKLHKLGARVVQYGVEYAEAYEAATKRAAETGALFCHAYDQPEICAGQGTLALELVEQVGELDTIVLAVGGGGLMAGVAAALEGRARVVAVEPKTIPTLHAALAAGGPVDVDVSGIAVDSLGARRAGAIAYQVAKRTGVRSVLVTDEAIIAARRQLWDQHRVIVEHGTAAALAALICGAYRPANGERVAILLCGGNTNPADLAS
jgi:threonine dehydratase